MRFDYTIAQMLNLLHLYIPYAFIRPRSYWGAFTVTRILNLVIRRRKAWPRGERSSLERILDDPKRDGQAYWEIESLSSLSSTSIDRSVPVRPGDTSPLQSLGPLLSSWSNLSLRVLGPVTGNSFYDLSLLGLLPEQVPQKASRSRSGKRPRYLLCGLRCDSDFSILGHEQSHSSHLFLNPAGLSRRS